jgi:EmrB/QacA subfamily drug resistance transporter
VQVQSSNLLGSGAELAIRQRVPALPGRWVFALTGMGAFLVSLDISIANAVLPVMSGSFGHPSRVALSWVIGAYAVSFAAVLVPAGRLADRAGRRQVFSCGLGLFALGSLVCGLAPSLWVLLLGRVLQAIGAAGANPASLGLLLASTPERERAWYTARWAGMGALGVGLGPLIGGALATLLSWRLAFLVNLPLVAVVLVAVPSQLVETQLHPGRRLPDPLGAVLLMAAAGLLTLSVSESTTWGWLDSRTLLAVGAAVVLGALFVRRSSRRTDPVLDIALLRDGRFALVTVATLAYSAAFFGLLFGFVLFLTTGWHMSIVEAGLGITPMAAIVFLLSTRVGRLAHRIGFRAPLSVGAALIGLGLLLALLATRGQSFDFGWLAVVLVCGVGLGLCYPLLGAAAVDRIAAGELASATAINVCARQLGAALGVAATVAAIDARSTATAQHFHRAWIVCASFAFLAAAATALLREHRAGGAAQPT